MRLFLALTVPAPTRDALAELQTALPMGRLVPAEDLHLTLAFVGEVDEVSAAGLHEEMERLRAPGFDLQAKGIGTFGGSSPRALWAGTAPEPQLPRLRDKIHSGLRRAGLELPRERFRPHFTLARFRRRLSGDEVERLRQFVQERSDFVAMPFAVEEFALFRSTLRPTGPIYERLVAYPLDPPIENGFSPVE